MEYRKAKEVIAEADYLKPNDFDWKDKLKWVRDVEERIREEIMDTHEDAAESDEVITEESLLYAFGAHADIYIYYIMAQIDRVNEEYDRFNNDMALYNGAYQSFERYWHNTHMPKNKGNFIL